ncbi:MAG: hypothetical protein ACRDOH_21740 [Streptosporangiaceae bacterium]
MAANARALGFYRRLGFRSLEVAEPGESAVLCLGRPLCPSEGEPRISE